MQGKIKGKPAPVAEPETEKSVTVHNYSAFCMPSAFIGSAVERLTTAAEGGMEAWEAF
jgi:hypothetical protein